MELYNATAAGLAAACLAQAQQCFLYIADASGKPKKLLAKLAKAVSDKYIDAMAALRNGLVRERVMCVVVVVVVACVSHPM